MSAFEVYKDYVALKNHFTQPKYDYIKYNGKGRLKPESFEARKDKVFFQRLAKNPEYHDFLIANLSHDPTLWIKDIAYSKEADKRFQEWKARQQSLTYNFKNDLKQLDTPFDHNLVCNGYDSYHPKLLQLYLGNHISLETICIILDLTGAIKHWDKAMEYDPIWQNLRLKITKYIPFVKYDKEKIKKIILDFFS